ncbi:lipopolysaccharide biosynthesis protein [Ammoniphilus sp. YIM 78166]|uniref:lipopolysaccharide biosynthesis protein n=1 Tax=Ammoniphilus sp. YIM 78166 TaxID=1644106 RepID=UPI00106F9A3C|nr:sugar translocase [Ammoniphilus sp. YIM 78166]
MRIQNSLKNIFFGLSGQFISILMGFIVRTIFIYTLGIEYLGVEGLFTSILMMLSLANLGFDTAMIYSLYKPLAEKDTYRIQALMNLYRRAYRLIGVIVLLIGLSILPFLPYLINGETTIDHIHVIYLLFLVNSVSSYYFIYKQAIIIADQRNHIISKIHSVFIISSNILQIMLLLGTGNYIVVLAAQIIFRISENVYIAKRADKLYPYLKVKNDAALSKDEKKLFFENLYALLLYRISGIVINGTDNIVISIFIGVTAVGMYSNYLLIMTTLTTFIGYIFYSITASVGNLHVKENAEKKYFIFRVLYFANFWIYGFCAVCLWNLLNPVIMLWIGEQFVFSQFIVFSIVLNFFSAGMQTASTTFRDTTGLFKKGKYRPIIAAFINIGVSIILVNKIGIAGVFLGTVISRLCTYFWYDPYVVFKYVFQKSVKVYFVRYAWSVLIVFIAAVLTDTLAGIFNENMLINIGIRTVLCLTIPNILFFIIFRKSEEFKYLWNIVSSLTSNIPSKLLKKAYHA